MKREGGRDAGRFRLRLTAAFFAFLSFIISAAVLTVCSGCLNNSVSQNSPDPAVFSEAASIFDDDSHTPSSSGRTPPPLTDEEIAFWQEAGHYLDYYTEIALNTEYGASDRKVHKWTEKVRFYVYPSEDAEKYKTFLQEHIDRLNSVEGFPGIVTADSPDDADLTLSFVTAKEMKDLPGTDNGDAYGYAQISWLNKNGQIVSGKIYIVNESDSSPEDVKHTLVEETTQAMGLLSDSYRFENSIFYQGYSTVSKPSYEDMLLFRIHYSPYIPAGSDLKQVSETVEMLSGHKK